jgi:hypothetical protein
MPLTGRTKRSRLDPSSPEAFLLWKTEMEDDEEAEENEELLRSLGADPAALDREFYQTIAKAGASHPGAAGALLALASSSSQDEAALAKLHPPLPPDNPGPVSNVLADA